MVNIICAIVLLLGSGQLAVEIYFRTRRKIYMRIAMIATWFGVLCGVAILVLELIRR